MVHAQTATNGLSGRAQTRVQISVVPRISTPPIVGVPILPPCNSASLCTSAAVRIGWPTLSEINFRITRGPAHRVIANDSRQAAAARNVIYWKRLRNEHPWAQIGRAHV